MVCVESRYLVANLRNELSEMFEPFEDILGRLVEAGLSFYIFTPKNQKRYQLPIA